MFNMTMQEDLPIYKEPPPCPESIISIPEPDGHREIPKIVTLNRLLLLLTDPIKGLINL